MIKAIVFDFDGLVLDTETPEFRSWQDTFRDHGATLELESWAQIIGTAEANWNPYSALEAAIRKPVDRVSVRLRRRARFAELMATEEIRPGVEEYLRDARSLGLKVAVASSSPRDWVTGYLAQHGIAGCFDVVKVADDVIRTKPDPEVYRCALDGLGVTAAEAMALEDSPNGVAAAKAAGLFCVAVPNELTGRLDLRTADLRITSLAALPLPDLLRIAPGVG